jgi:hypothetical protein
MKQAPQFGWPLSLQSDLHKKDNDRNAQTFYELFLTATRPVS